MQLHIVFCSLYPMAVVTERQDEAIAFFLPCDCRDQLSARVNLSCPSRFPSLSHTHTHACASAPSPHPILTHRLLTNTLFSTQRLCRSISFTIIALRTRHQLIQIWVWSGGGGGGLSVITRTEAFLIKSHLTPNRTILLLIFHTSNLAASKILHCHLNILRVDPDSK